MAKKLSDIKDLVEASTENFKTYLEVNIDQKVLRVLNSLREVSTVYIFSGVIRNYFLGISEVRDLDIVLSTDVNIEKYFSSFQVHRNSFGGYKIKVGDIFLDIWTLDSSWALKHQKNLNFETAKHVPSTAFFNFSSIMFNLNENSFYYTKHFLRFLQNKEIDVVYKPNFNYELCVLNSFYYSHKFNLKISDKLQKYIVYLNKKIKPENYEKVQIKHFGKILYSYNDILNEISNLSINDVKKSPEVYLVYKKTVPSKFFTEFRKDIERSEIILATSIDNEEWLNFTGPELYDVIIYIKNNILSPAIYDIFKTGVIKLIEKIKGNSKKEINSKKISIRFEDEKERNIEINIEGDFKKKEIKSIIEEAFKVFSKDERERLFKDKRYVSETIFNPKIEMKYNWTTKKWEPTNFEEIRKQLDDLLKEAEDRFNS